MAETLFLEVAQVLVLAAGVGVLAVLLRQPLLVGFLLAGLLAGPEVLGLVTQMEPFEVLGELGIVLLLFAVGLELDPRLVRQLGPLALVTGTVQVLVTSVLGFALALALGFDPLPAVYVAVAFSFSSTLIIVKLISVARDTETLHGRLAIGLLIVQDVWVVVVLVLLSLVRAGEVFDEGVSGSFVFDLAGVVVAGLVLMGVAYVATRFVFPWILDWLGRSRELLLVFSLAWGVGLAGAAEAAGLSAELGGFVAGLSLAASDYAEAVGSRLVSLRDFMLLFFFIVLGATLDLSLLAGLVVPVVVFVAFVFLLKPLLVFLVFSRVGFRGRTSFLTASLMGQTSEFGLILGSMGVSLGHLAGEGLALITAVTFATMVVSTYVILNNREMYDRLRPVVNAFEREELKPPLEEERGEPVDVVVFGLGRFGGALARTLAGQGWRVQGRDLDPRAVGEARRTGLDAAYADAEDPEYLSQMDLEGVRLVVSTIPQVGANRVLAKGLEEAGYKGSFRVTAHRKPDAQILEEDGFRVLLPFDRAGEEAADVLSDLLREQEAGGG